MLLLQIVEAEDVIRLAELDLEGHTEQVHKEKADILVQLVGSSRH